MLIEKLGEDPSYDLTIPNTNITYSTLYGRLLGLIEGEQVGDSGFSNDTLIVQFTRVSGEEVGNPIQMPMIHLYPGDEEFDTLWDFKRFFGSIESSFETEFGSEIFDMVLYGILDPSGDLGLNTLGAAINLPDDFVHGWLTHYAYFGNDYLPTATDPLGTDAVNAFNEVMLDPVEIIFQLARDTKFGIYEPGVRERVIHLIGLLVELDYIDPSKVVDPTLAVRATRLRDLGARSSMMSFQAFNSEDSKTTRRAHWGGRATSREENAAAMCEVVLANLEIFSKRGSSLMKDLINAGNGTVEALNIPSALCRDDALEAYFKLLDVPVLTGDPEVDQLLQENARYRRGFARGALLHNNLNDDAGFTARTREAFNRIGYGTTAEVKDIVDDLNFFLPSQYAVEFESGIRELPMIEFDAPFIPPTFTPTTELRALELEGVDSGLYSEGMSDEFFIQELLWLVKDIYFNLPPDAPGRDGKINIVKTWRQKHLDDFQTFLDGGGISFPGETPELSAEQEFFRHALTDGWKVGGGGGSVPDVEG